MQTFCIGRLFLIVRIWFYSNWLLYSGVTSEYVNLFVVMFVLFVPFFGGLILLLAITGLLRNQILDGARTIRDGASVVFSSRSPNMSQPTSSSRNATRVHKKERIPIPVRVKK